LNLQIAAGDDVIERWIRVCGKRPYLVLAFVISVSLVMAYGVTKVSMTAEMREFLSKDYPSVKTTLKFENAFGSTTTETILLRSDNVLSAEVIKALLEFEVTLKSDPQLKKFIIQTRAFTDYVIPPILEANQGVLPPDDELESSVLGLLAQPSIQAEVMGKLITFDQKRCLIKILVNSALPFNELEEGTRVLHKRLNDFDLKYDFLSTAITGGLSIKLDTAELMHKDNKTLIPAAIALMIAVLFLTFRKFSDALLPLALIGMSATWVLGLMGYLGIKFTMVHVAVVPLILGISIDYGIHMLHRYREERARGLNAEGAALTSLQTVGAAISLTAVTTIIGFSSFLISDVPPIRTFGGSIAAGAFFTFILSTTFLPTVLILRDRRKATKISLPKNRWMNNVLEKLARETVSHRRSIALAAGCVTIVCIILALGISTAFSYEMFLSKDLDSVTALEEVEEHFGAQRWLFVLVEGDITSPKSLQTMLELERSVLSDPRSENLILDQASLADAILLANLNKLPENRERISELISYLRQKAPEEVARLLTSTNDLAAIYFVADVRTDIEMREATEIVRTHVRGFENAPCCMTLDGEPAVGGDVATAGDVLGGILRNAFKTMVLAFALCLIVLTPVLRSIPLGVIAAMPIMLTLSWEFGTLRTLGWPLDMLTMSISALLIGVGVDFGVHVVYRFKEEMSRRKAGEAVKIALSRVGASILSAAATTIGVFALLSFSRMPAVQRFGNLTASVVLYALLAALLILPPMLMVYVHRRR
jgi:hypothetical protein